MGVVVNKSLRIYVAYISYQCFSPLFFCSSSRLSSCQWFHNEAVPLSWSPQSVGICPIKNRPHLLIRILDCCACKPKATQAIEPMICHCNFSGFILYPVNFVDNYATPWESVEGINFPTRKIKRGQDWGIQENQSNPHIMMDGAANRHRNVPFWSRVERLHVPSGIHCTYRLRNNPTITSVGKTTIWRRGRDPLFWTPVPNYGQPYLEQR